MIKVFSHPRSGTHFIELFLKENFYPKEDLFEEEVEWGHWANRQYRDGGSEYGKLFGSHYFARTRYEFTKQKRIYIYRDGRAVAYSIWKTPNFLHPDLKGISFSDFLRVKLDWHGTPGVKSEPKFTIAEHWSEHVTSWLTHRSTLYIKVKYEDLVDDPTKIYRNICLHFFPMKYFRELLNPQKIVGDLSPTGLLPNSAKKDSWREAFNENDLEYFKEQLNPLTLSLYDYSIHC